jgi:hypothetical protein
VKRQRFYFVALFTGALVGSGFILWQLKTHDFYLEVFPQGIILGTAIQQGLSLLFLKTLNRE